MHNGMSKLWLTLASFVETAVGCVASAAGEENLGKARKLQATCSRSGAHCEAHLSGVLSGPYDKQQRDVAKVSVLCEVSANLFTHTSPYPCTGWPRSMPSASLLASRLTISICTHAATRARRSDNRARVSRATLDPRSSRSASCCCRRARRCRRRRFRCRAAWPRALYRTSSAVRTPSTRLVSVRWVRAKWAHQPQ